MCLFRFSRYILVPLVLDWLDKDDLTQLDSALTNERLREYMTDLMVEYKEKFLCRFIPNDTTVALSEPLVNWLNRRRMGTLETIVVENTFMQQIQSTGSTKVQRALSKLSLSGWLNSKSKDIKSVDLQAMIQFLGCVKHIELPNFMKANTNAIVEIINYCTVLESIKITHCESNDLIKALKNSSVSLRGLEIYSSAVKEKTVRHLCRQSPSLSSLALKQTLELSSGSWHQLIVNNRQLTTLSMDKVNNKSLQQFSLHHGSSSASPLRELSCHQVTDVSVRCLVWSLGPHLTSLDLSYSPSVNDFTLSEVGAACPSLLEIRLKNCYNLSTAGVHALCSQLPALQLLDLRNVGRLTNEAVASVVLQCRGLHTLLLYSQEHITKVGLRYIGSYAVGLRHLSLCNMHVSDDTLVHIMHRCPLLVDLELGINGRLTDQAIAHIAPVHGGRLRRLDLTCCDRLTELTLFVLAEHCNQLTDLNVSICNLVSDKAVVRVVQECRALRVLSVYYCKCVSDISMEALASYGKRLTDLNIGHTAVVLSASVEALIRSCTRLRHLKLTHAEQDRLVSHAARVNSNLMLQFL